MADWSSDMELSKERRAAAPSPTLTFFLGLMLAPPTLLMLLLMVALWVTLFFSVHSASCTSTVKMNYHEAHRTDNEKDISK